MDLAKSGRGVPSQSRANHTYVIIVVVVQESEAIIQLGELLLLRCVCVLSLYQPLLPL